MCVLQPFYPNLVFRPCKQLWHFATLHVRCSCCWTQQGVFWATQTPGRPSPDQRQSSSCSSWVTSTHTGLPHYTATELHCWPKPLGKLSSSIDIRHRCQLEAANPKSKCLLVQKKLSTRIHFQSFTCKKDLESWNPLRHIWYIEKSGLLSLIYASEASIYGTAGVCQMSGNALPNLAALGPSNLHDKHHHSRS